MQQKGWRYEVSVCCLHGINWHPKPFAQQCAGKLACKLEDQTGGHGMRYAFGTFVQELACP